MLRLFLFLFILGGLTPPDLKPQKGCRLWKGTASGNDPSVKVQLLLCEKDEAIVGELQWSSEKSGWNKRAVAGVYDDKSKNRITLRDTAFIEYKPNWPWKFCLIDQYKLVKDKDILQGSYFSKSCEDRASLKLSLIQ